MTTTAVKLLKTIQSEAVINDSEQAFPVAATPDSDFVRQGDVYIWLKSRLHQDAKRIKPVLQLAPGTTKGSRHCLDSLEGVEMFEIADADALQGPYIKLNCERVIEHPEHGNWRLPVGIYEITYQRAFAKELRRVRD